MINEKDNLLNSGLCRSGEPRNETQRKRKGRQILRRITASLRVARFAEKSPGILRRLCCLSDSGEGPSAKVSEKLAIIIEPSTTY